MDGPLIWLHAVSVGETQASAPWSRRCSTPTLNARCSDPHDPHRPGHRRQSCSAAWPRVQTSICPTICLGRRALPAPLPPTHRGADGNRAVAQPGGGLPALGIPLALVNARLSGARRRLRARRSLARDAVAHLSPSASQTEADGQRLTALGARWLQVTGNISSTSRLRTPAGHWAQRSRSASARPGAPASTREGEEGPCWRPSPAAARPEVLLVLVPRHPQRFDGVGGQAGGLSGLKQQRRSDEQPRYRPIRGSCWGFDGRDVRLLCRLRTWP